MAAATRSSVPNRFASTRMPRGLAFVNSSAGPRLAEHAPRDLGDLERRAHGRVDGFQFAAAFEVGEELPQVAEHARRLRPDGIHYNLPLT